MKRTVKRTLKVAVRHEPVIKEAVEVHICGSCGQRGPQPHLCSANQNGPLYMCSYCGIYSDSPRHVCRPMLVDMKYYCDTCGRVTPTRTRVCKPKAIK